MSASSSDTVDGAELAMSAAAEWTTLVTVAVLGTDRRPLPPAAAGWESLSGDDDPAAQLLDRAAAVTTARRCGMRPMPAPSPMPPAPDDPRPLCPAIAARHLARLMRGEYDLLVPEWFALCETVGCQPPGHLVPALLVRGRRFPAFDAAARRLVGASRATWLAEAIPELGIKAATISSTPVSQPAEAQQFVPLPPPPDSAAVVTAIIETFFDRSATWAAAAQLRLAVASIDPAWLPALLLELNRAPFHTVTERTRVDLAGLAQFRLEMIRALQVTPSAQAVTLPRG